MTARELRRALKGVPGDAEVLVGMIGQAEADKVIASNNVGVGGNMSGMLYCTLDLLPPKDNVCLLVVADPDDTCPHLTFTPEEPTGK